MHTNWTPAVAEERLTRARHVAAAERLAKTLRRTRRRAEHVGAGVNRQEVFAFAPADEP